MCQAGVGWIYGFISSCLDSREQQWQTVGSCKDWPQLSPYVNQKHKSCEGLRRKSIHQIVTLLRSFIFTEMIHSYCWHFILGRFCACVSHWKSHLHSLMMDKQVLHIFLFHPYCHSVRAPPSIHQHPPPTDTFLSIWDELPGGMQPNLSHNLSNCVQGCCWVLSAASRWPFWLILVVV